VPFIVRERRVPLVRGRNVAMHVHESGFAGDSVDRSTAPRKNLRDKHDHCDDIPRVALECAIEPSSGEQQFSYTLTETAGTRRFPILGSPYTFSPNGSWFLYSGYAPGEDPSHVYAESMVAVALPTSSTRAPTYRRLTNVQVRVSDLPVFDYMTRTLIGSYPPGFEGFLRLSVPARWITTDTLRIVTEQGTWDANPVTGEVRRVP
jgi:hypothetical protein